MRENDANSDGVYNMAAFVEQAKNDNDDDRR